MLSFPRPALLCATTQIQRQNKDQAKTEERENKGKRKQRQKNRGKDKTKTSQSTKASLLRAYVAPSFKPVTTLRGLGENCDASQCIAVLSLLVQSLCRNYIASIDHISFLLFDFRFELYLHLLHANRSQRLRVGRGTEEDRNVWIRTLRWMSPDVWIVVPSSILSSDVDNYLE